jgi:hypothetical protein
MPLARIITDVADDCLELITQLRARGYQVETVAPGDVSTTPADLEVRLEECAPEDVVSRAALNSPSDDLWVYVAPGALDNNAVPIRTVPLSTSLTAERTPALAKSLSIVPREKVERPPVVGALAIDAHEEDPILAELRAFPTLSMAEKAPEPISAIVVEIPDVARQAPVADAEKPSPASNEKALKAPEKAAEPGPDETPVELLPVKWLIDPNKPAKLESQPVVIPIAPDPVRAKIHLPSNGIPRPAKRKISRNFQPLQVACGLAVLSVVASLLILIGYPPAVATSGRSGAALQTPRAAPVTVQSAAKSALQLEKKPAASKVADPAPAVAKSVPSLPAATSAKAAPKAHSHDEGLIAEDTVVFYDRNKPGPPRAKAQPEPATKRYTDQN